MAQTKYVSVIGFVAKLQKEAKARFRESSRLGLPLTVSPVNKSGYQVVSPTMESRRQEQTFNIPTLGELTRPWEP